MPTATGGQFGLAGCGLSCACGITEPRVTYKADRILRVDFKYAGHEMAVINVYAPSLAAERAAFFSMELPRAIEGGDYIFNCVMRATYSDPPPPQQPDDSRLAGRDQLESLMLVNELGDAWLLPQVRRQGGLTWSTHARQFTHAQLDRWLTPTCTCRSGSMRSRCSPAAPSNSCLATTPQLSCRHPCSKPPRPRHVDAATLGA